MKHFKSKMLIMLSLFYSCSDRIPTKQEERNSIIEISGTISGILKTKNTYKVINTIYVDSLSSLVIESGVRIIFADSAYMIIYGNLQSLGAESSPVVFTSFDEKWKGIKIINASDTSALIFSKIENVHLEDEDSLNYGALGIKNSNVIIRNSIFKNNYALSGGGIYAEYSSVNISNSIFSNNSSVAFGGGILLFNSNSLVFNNTFYSNYSQDSGGGVVIFHLYKSIMQNNIFYQNVGDINYNDLYIFPQPTNNYIEQYNFYENNNNDPHFISETNFHLQAGSPCIDAGNPDSSYNDANGTRNDQGAYGGPGGDW